MQTHWLNTVTCSDRQNKIKEIIFFLSGSILGVLTNSNEFVFKGPL